MNHPANYLLNLWCTLWTTITANFGGKPSLDQSDQKTLIKNLSKQLETISVNSILDDKKPWFIQLCTAKQCTFFYCKLGC